MVIQMGHTWWIGNIQRMQCGWFEIHCREVSEIYSGSFPSVRIQSDCRCGASKPRIHPQATTMCIDNGMVSGDAERMRMNNSSIGDSWRRLDVNSHSLEFVNDGDVGTFWVSTPLQQISLTITFGDVFQVLANSRIIVYTVVHKDWNFWKYYFDIFILWSMQCRLYKHAEKL